MKPIKVTIYLFLKCFKLPFVKTLHISRTVKFQLFSKVDILIPSEPVLTSNMSRWSLLGATQGSLNLNTQRLAPLYCVPQYWSNSLAGACHMVKNSVKTKANKQAATYLRKTVQFYTLYILYIHSN